MRLPMGKKNCRLFVGLNSAVVRAFSDLLQDKKDCASDTLIFAFMSYPHTTDQSFLCTNR